MLAKSHKTGFPVFCLERAGKNSEFLNAVILYKIDPFTLEVQEVAEYQFAKQDDGCMSLAAHPNKSSFVAGVNHSPEMLQLGDNWNCRFFYIQNKSIHFRHVALLASANARRWWWAQRMDTYAARADLQLTFWSWPGMIPSLPAQDFENSEILDLHVDSASANVAVVTPSKLRVLDLAKGKIRWAVENIKIGSVACSIRSARFGVDDNL
ncbi:hypothetical protein HDU91_000066 [Kappamyces sp. JEL0680]|nr:hypothetical protein HDU91_000066 [Kappamyces sp. JEL0680]